MSVCLIIPVAHGHAQGDHLNTCIVVKLCVSRAISVQHVCMHHLHYSPKAVQYTYYVLVSQKGTKIALVPKTKRQHVNYYV